MGRGGSKERIRPSVARNVTTVTPRVVVTPWPACKASASACIVPIFSVTAMARGTGTFGLVSSRGRGRGGARSGYRGNSTSFRGRGRGGRGGGPNALPKDAPAPLRDEDGTALEERFERVRINDEVDEKLGFGLLQDGPRKEGWLVNMHPVRLLNLRITTYQLIHTLRHY